jgi:hypothetical protein
MKRQSANGFKKQMEAMRKKEMSLFMDLIRLPLTLCQTGTAVPGEKTRH